ncbi:MAG: acyltransferase [Candidatus Velthaea sp.]
MNGVLGDDRVADSSVVGVAAAISVPARGHLDWIDVLRGVAALGVAVFHAIPTLWVGAFHHIARFSATESVASLLSYPARFGYAGVMLFFLLSGFVIHLPNAGKQEFDVRSYAARRFLRIYPPYAAALLLSVSVALLLPRVVGYHGGWFAFGKALLMLQNYPHPGGSLRYAELQPAGNFALWSLPIELELYLVYPLVLLASRRWGVRQASFAVVVSALAATLVDMCLGPASGVLSTIAGSVPAFLHYLVIWCAGALLADRLAKGDIPKWDGRWTMFFAVGAALSLSARYVLKLPVDVEDFLWASTFWCGLVWIVAHPGVRATLASSALAPMRYLGTISYSLYLTHLPTFYIIGAACFAATGFKTTNFLMCLGACAIAILVAAVFYGLIEKPSIAFAARFGRMRARTRVASAPTLISSSSDG